MRRTAWLPWLWGHVRWHDCAPPWERNPAPCTLCSGRHGASVQSRLLQCPVWNAIFMDHWVGWWGAMSQLATTWLSSTSESEHWKCVCLHIPKTLVDSLPLQEKPFLRKHVALFQFQALQGVRQLREQLVGPAPHTTSVSPLWLTPYTQPNSPPPLVTVPTAKQLREQVHAPWGIKPRREAKRPLQEPVDVETWIAQAMGAKDTDAVQHIQQRPALLTAMVQQAETKLIALVELHQILLEAYCSKTSTAWEDAQHCNVDG